MADVYGADEAFITGTFAGLTPVAQVDGRIIGDGSNKVGDPDSLTKKLEAMYIALIEQDLKLSTANRGNDW